MNKVILIGNLTKEHEVKQLQGGTAVLKNSIAVARKSIGQNGEKETDFFNFDLFGNNIQNVLQYTRKGSKVCIVGEIRNSTYQDPTTGQNRTSTSILAREVEFLDSRNAQPQGQGQQPFAQQQQFTPQPQQQFVQQQQPQFKQQPQPQQQFTQSFDLNDDDLPF